MSNYTIEQLVNVLQKASDAYYNGGEEILSDEAYDALRDELETRDPSNPFLKQIGAPVEKGAVRLPHKMPSLTKIKPGGAVAQFASSCRSQEWVMSDKLDGISVLWVAHKKQLFLRGDGLMGVNISQYVPYIQGLKTPLYDCVIRGELIVPEGVLPPGTLGRSWVNGLVHHKRPQREDARKLHFVAYQMVVPAIYNRERQFDHMKLMGFEVPWFCFTDEINDTILSETLQERRTNSPYAIDGIVVGENCIPVPEVAGDDVTNPKDMRAFKMPLGDQKATTRVVDIIWSASYQGYWIPRIQIEPVQIGGSRIEFLTGHNARFILDNKLTKGSTIVVRKSGDVIPTLDHVIESGSGSIELPNGVWDGPEATAKHLKLAESATDEHQDVIQKRLEHFASTLEVPYLGPGLITKLVAAGIKTPSALVSMSQSNMAAAIGTGMSDKIYPALQTAFANITEKQLMIASGTMPRGVSEKKLRVLFEANMFPSNWNKIISAAGWSQDALKSFVKDSIPSYEAWRRREFPALPYPVAAPISVVAPVTAPVLPAGVQKQFVCFTGFRSAEMETKLKAKGHEVSDSVTKKTTIVVVPNTTAIQSPSAKVKKAMESPHVKILTAEQLSKEYL